MALRSHRRAVTSKVSSRPSAKFIYDWHVCFARPQVVAGPRQRRETVSVQRTTGPDDDRSLMGVGEWTAPRLEARENNRQAYNLVGEAVEAAAQVFRIDSLRVYFFEDNTALEATNRSGKRWKSGDTGKSCTLGKKGMIFDNFASEMLLSHLRRGKIERKLLLVPS